ncbi:MAG TPA: hypothetical protein VH370_12135 [Humisphaera sp.]|jgi:hypothetical protein|nr:hypothetical protein [Humisphaera sp.]
MVKRSRLASLPFLALYAAAIGAVILNALRSRWASAAWYPIAVGLVAALGIIPLQHLMQEQLVGPSPRRSVQVGFLFFASFFPLVALPFLGRHHLLLMVGLILMSGVFLWAALGTLRKWPGFRDPSASGIKRDDKWLDHSQLLSDVSFDIALLVQRQVVIMGNQRFSVQERFPKLKGEPIEQPDLPGLLEMEHDYFRLAFTKDVMGHEEELLRYYRSALAICRSLGLDPKSDRDCRSCFGISLEFVLPSQMFRPPIAPSDVQEIHEFITMMLTPGDGVKFSAEDQTGDDTIEARGDYLHLHRSDSGKESINVRFLREPFENQLKAALERLEAILGKLRNELGEDYWSKPDRTWSMYRQDDNGNRFLIQGGLMRAQAEAQVRQFEALGHKQTYWTEPQGS